MEPRSRPVAAARHAVVALAVAAAACGSPSGIALSPSWTAAGVPVARATFGHNTVWARDGLGLWDAAHAHADDAAFGEVFELQPGLLRFPGGTRAMRYRFDRALGPSRTPQCDPFRGVLDDTPYGPDEFFTVADALGADVTWVAPWVDGSPTHTAQLAAYLGARASVKFLEIGNEPYLGLPAGPVSGSCGRPSQFVQDERWDGTTRIPTTAADYAAQLKLTAPLVRAAASSLRIGAAATSQYDGASDAMTAVGDVDAAATRDPWNARLVADARDAFDFFILHPYDFTVDDDARIRLADRARKTVRDLRAAAPDKGVAITEYGFLFGGGTLLNAIVTADMTRMSVEEQLLMTARHILIETDASGPFADSAAIGPSLARKPGFAAAKLVRALADVAVPLAGAGDGILATDGTHSDGTMVALATRDAATRRLAVLVIDRRVDDGPTRTVRLALPPGGWRATQRTLHADTLAATTVAVDARDLGHTSTTIAVEVLPHSVVILAADAE